MFDPREYEIRKDQEGIWAAIQTAVIAVAGWGLTENTNLETVSVLLVAGAIGTVSRPVLAYLASFLPKKKTD